MSETHDFHSEMASEHPFHGSPSTCPGSAAPGTAALAPTGAPTSDERQLIAAVLQRDRKATGEFVVRYTDVVYTYVQRRLAPRTDLVDDVVQEVFLAALRGLPSFRGGSPVQSWLLGIARHKVESHYRECLRQFEPLGEEGRDEPADDALPIDERLSQSELRARAQHVLSTLPAQYAFVLRWRYWENRSVREIAHAVGKSEKAVERLLARSRARFRAAWEKRR
jgi:RNA polymerase sigma-70 factor (ECF subfamily)